MQNFFRALTSQVPLFARIPKLVWKQINTTNKTFWFRFQFLFFSLSNEYLLNCYFSSPLFSGVRHGILLRSYLRSLTASSWSADSNSMSFRYAKSSNSRILFCKWKRRQNREHEKLKLQSPNEKFGSIAKITSPKCGWKGIKETVKHFAQYLIKLNLSLKATSSEQIYSSLCTLRSLNSESGLMLCFR